MADLLLLFTKCLKNQIQLSCDLHAKGCKYTCTEPHQLDTHERAQTLAEDILNNSHTVSVTAFILVLFYSHEYVSFRA